MTKIEIERKLGTCVKSNIITTISICIRISVLVNFTATDKQLPNVKSVFEYFYNVSYLKEIVF